jgi:iron complex outermembrane receptor protein
VFNFGPLSSQLDLTYAGKQSRVADNELPTDAYTMLDMSVNYAFDMNRAMLEVFAKANNILDGEARVHSSVLKDIAPLAGRGLLIGLKASL